MLLVVIVRGQGGIMTNLLRHMSPTDVTEMKTQDLEYAMMLQFQFSLCVCLFLHSSGLVKGKGTDNGASTTV